MKIWTLILQEAGEDIEAIGSYASQEAAMKAADTMFRAVEGWEHDEPCGTAIACHDSGAVLSLVASDLEG